MSASPTNVRWVLLASILVLAGWIVGHQRTAANDDAQRAADGRLPPRWTGAAAAPGGAFPFSLPEGVEVDPVTGQLVGLELDGATPWTLLESYTYQPALAELPESIRSLDGTEVTMIGFLLAQYDFEDIKTFDLVASHYSCCYGTPPGLSGSVHVQLSDAAEGLALTILPLRVTGTFRVREMKESGIVFSIFALDEAEATVLQW